ncbi:protein PIMREG isoform X2 [Heteronotia binoei]|uniref:protein PIMREG isoform X2 n=1 Tax=Heteronotia binoei TaxID=13085 RepID=UPI00292EFC82|nr:protein PIMREG isoform X2 [Heteronotia binoei]XP_060114941.1 protein PIMREG isoform X2 [Heteronotia binoei]XP_060114942.1 protein PIMREG isoform X2 [Heteronotia binoei]XP_060114943.1 protein PIMREG isoform X2 [Heteronotia binoei]
MASVFQSMGSTVGWRSHKILADFEESPAPDRFRKRSSRNLNAVRMSLRKRMPLKPVEMNFDENPTWESLEAKEKSQNLQALTRTAKNVFGTVSQKIHKSCQGSTQTLVTALAKASMTGDGGSTRTRRSSPHTPRRKSNRLAAISTPTSSTKMVPESDQRSSFQSGSRRLREDPRPLRRSRRTAALRSPYGSPVCSGLRRQFDCDLEMISTGIRQLKRLSHAFNDIIAQEERDQAIANYCRIMTQNVQAAHLQSQSRSRLAFRKRALRLQRVLSRWAEIRWKNY